MKIFLSALRKPFAEYFVSQGLTHFKWNLMSYYGLKRDEADYIKAHSDEVMIDSGAHSFQYGKKVNWVEYTKEYAKFIESYDEPKVVGFFEMDVDNILGYDKVLELRKILEQVSDKIIPVWHVNRGIDDFKKMCQKYSGKVVAITGFKNKEIRDDQYIQFLKYAWKYNCRVHCLGMTRKEVMNKVPFDYVDSSSWLQEVVYGNVYNPKTGKKQKVSREQSRVNREQCYLLNYKAGMKMQEDYYFKWRKYEK